MAYIPILNSQIDPDSPLTTGLFFQLRDNTTFGRNPVTGQFIAAGYENDSISDAKLFDVPGLSFKGKHTAGVGNPVNMTVPQAQTLLGLQALAFLSSVGQAQVGSGAIHRDELSDTTVSFTTGIGFVVGPVFVTVDLGGADYLFDPAISVINNALGGTQNRSVILDTKTVSVPPASAPLSHIYTIGLENSPNALIDFAPNALIQAERIDASPPWKISEDEGEVPIFIYASIRAGNHPIPTEIGVGTHPIHSIFSSTNPPWESTKLDNNYLAGKPDKLELLDKWGVAEEDLGKKYKIKRNHRGRGVFEDILVEITSATKNDLMLDRPDPFYGKKGAIYSKQNEDGTLTTEDNSNNTVVLLDPSETGPLLELMKAGYDINKFILDGDLIIGNDFLSSRKSPNADKVKIVPIKWR